MITPRRVLSSLCICTTLILLIPTVLLWLFQNRLIFIPRHYPPGVSTTLSPLPYRISEGAQTAYLRPARGTLHRVWVLFGGNAALALEWSWLCDDWPRADDALLLIDYPGYGSNAGSPSKDAIERSSEAAFLAFASALQRSPEQMEQHLGVIGHSLGAGVALQFCQRHAVERVVLIAPFTSLRDMARLRVGWPLCLLLSGNFDNRARLHELASRAVPPQVLIVHGSADEIIPERMGHELAGIVPGTDFRSVSGGDHVSVLDEVAGMLSQVAR